jgi:hypothetical protein
MAAARRSRRTNRFFRQTLSKQNARRRHRTTQRALDHAVQIIYRICCLAGAPELIDEIRAELRAERILTAIRRHDTAPLFDWLAAALSYQGISDQVATDYMAQHGRASWQRIEADMAASPTCPRLRSYWHFAGCRYDKISKTCAEPDHIEACPLSAHDLRNGRLNQTAYSLFLFIRDVANGDLVGWIDDRLASAAQPADKERPARLAASLIEPLRHVYGVSDKTLAMTLSCVLLAAPRGYYRWRQVGGSMIAIDTLVHNFLHRTGVLARFGADHPYGPGCYRARGCADMINVAAQQIDARAFNPDFPATFPRFVQHAIWRYCAQNGLAICNGNRIDDHKRCDNIYCQIRPFCDRVVLHKSQ